MSGTKRRSKRRRNKARIRPDADQFWREDEAVEESAPVGEASDPTATLRSIGTPPVPGGDGVANEFLKTALRASSLVTVLAHSVNLSGDDQAD